MPASRAELQRIINLLSDRDSAEDPRAFPRDRVAAGSPELYSWWADSRARKQLGQALGVSMPSLIYVGQTGATQWPSGKKPKSTLVGRIRTNHINGNTSVSTFRWTISAILREPLHLRVAEPGLLVSDDNRKITAWIKEHLKVAIAPYDDRDSLKHVEEAVLAKLDPPLNLGGMAFTPFRQRLRKLRRRITHPYDGDHRA